MATTKSKKTNSRRTNKLPGFVSFKNPRFAGSLMLVVLLAAFGSIRLYQANAATIPTIAECRAYSPNPVLYVGVQNQEMCNRTFESFLNFDKFFKGAGSNPAWPGLNVDGTFDNNTYKAVVAFQFSHNMLIDGSPYRAWKGAVTTNDWLVASNDCASYRGLNNAEFIKLCGRPAI